MCLFRIQLSILRPTAGLTPRRSPAPAIDPLARAGARDGDGFWSNALAVYARDQGPRMTNLGNVQEIFSRPAPINSSGLLFAPRPLSFSWPHEFDRLELADRFGIRPTQIK